jgi:CRISPR/Cas system CSM-associated protein Csm2 small subunit
VEPDVALKKQQFLQTGTFKMIASKTYEEDFETLEQEEYSMDENEVEYSYEDTGSINADEEVDTDDRCGEMPEVVVFALIKKMGVTGGGLDRLSESKNSKEKTRFWMDIYKELKEQFRQIGSKDATAVMNKWNNLASKFKKAKVCANKSGSGRPKFKFYDAMMAEVGSKPKFCAEAVIDSRGKHAIQKVEEQTTKKQKTCDDVIDNNAEQEYSSGDDKRNRYARKSLQERQLDENRKLRKFLEQSSQERDKKSDKFMEDLVTHATDMKGIMARQQQDQHHFNDRFFNVMERLLSKR